MSDTKEGGAFRVEQLLDPEALRADMELDMTAIDEAVRRQASLYIYYSTIAAKARRQHDTLKTQFEILESKLDGVHRKKLTEESEKKPTEAQIAAAVKSDSRYYAAQQKLADARMIMDLANDAKEALCQRKDMLVQITADRRIEMQGDMRIKVAQSSEQEARTRVLGIVQANAS